MGYETEEILLVMFLNSTNDRVESINVKVKQIIPIYCYFEECFIDFGVFINSTRIYKGITKQLRKC